MDETFRCDHCGAIFTDPDVHESYEDMNGEGAWERWTTYYCPVCGSGSLSPWDGEEEDA